MEGYPLISIVTPSLNQGRFLGETLQSLLDQDYPALEVIIQDGGSTDNSIAVAESFVQRRPDIFKLNVSRDSGQADALNRGFARTRGAILGFLNSDDTLFPGCLRRVAREIDPSRNRYIVFGRCLFTGEKHHCVGVEHPAEYTSHFELLAIWKRGYNNIPQPSVFWHREVWQQCGGFNTAEHHVLDYDLFCRFSRRYRFHKIDELWSTFRMHDDSKSFQRTEAEVLAMSIAVSRRYWGPWYSPLRWRCEVSHWYHHHDRYEKARHHARKAEEASKTGNISAATGEFLATLFYSPKMAKSRLLQAWLANVRSSLLQRMLRTDGGFHGRYSDLWVGPHYRADLEPPAHAKRLVLTLRHVPQGFHQSITLILFVNRKKISRVRVSAGGTFTMEADISRLAGKRCAVEIRGSPYFTPRQVHKVPDDRALVVQLLDTQFA